MCTDQEVKAPFPHPHPSSLFNSCDSPCTLTFIYLDSWPQYSLPLQFQKAQHWGMRSHPAVETHPRQKNSYYCSTLTHSLAKWWQTFTLLISESASSSLLPDDDSSESGSANGLPALTSPEVLAVGGNPPDGGAPYGEVTENGLSAPLDFSTTSPSSSSEDQQPVNLSDRLLPAGNTTPNSYPADPNRKYPIKTEYSNKVRLFDQETKTALLSV